MSLYNAIFGQNQLAPVLLQALGLTASDVPRFRDCYLSEGSIVIYTRTGGGNRDYYESEESCRECYPEYFQNKDEAPAGPWNEDLRSNKYYLSDEDDDFDSTYAYFRFSYPPEYEEDLKAIAADGKDFSPSEKWQLLFDSMSASAKQS